MKVKIKKGDKVAVLAGKDKGKIGEVKAVIKSTEPKKSLKVIVSGVQVVKIFNKRKLMAGITSKEMPLDISNVAHVDPKDSRATKVKIEMKDNQKVLVSKRSGEVIRVIIDKNKEKQNV